MFGAQLFLIGAIAIALIASFPVKLTDATFDIYVHDTYFVVAPRHAILGFALLCGLFAGFYYLGDRILGHRLNNGLALAHFILWAVALIVLTLAPQSLGRALRAGQDPNQSWLFFVGLVTPVVSLIVGAGLFLVNVAWAIVLRLKTA
jgi:cytochrome c oxidase subunit I